MNVHYEIAKLKLKIPPINLYNINEVIYLLLWQESNK